MSVDSLTSIVDLGSSDDMTYIYTYLYIDVYIYDTMFGIPYTI